MIPNDTIKAAMVTKLKAATAVTDVLAAGSGGVKEAQYQGSDYSYPGVRVYITRQTPDSSAEQCDTARMIAGVRCYVEGPSSLPADDLAGLVNAALHRGQLRGGTLGVDAFYIPRVYCVGLLAAIRLGERLWMSDVMIEGNVFPSDDMGGGA